MSRYRSVMKETTNGMEEVIVKMSQEDIDEYRFIELCHNIKCKMFGVTNAYIAAAVKGGKCHSCTANLVTTPKFTVGSQIPEIEMAVKKYCKILEVIDVLYEDTLYVLQKKKHINLFKPFMQLFYQRWF